MAAVYFQEGPYITEWFTEEQVAYIRAAERQLFLTCDKKKLSPAKNTSVPILHPIVDNRGKIAMNFQHCQARRTGCPYS